ncbi:MAG: hypothetical protein IAE80_07195 [Anaerolinea sp.]|nr:hypothetical protein [Anaerolinea sp.]
MRKLLLLGSLLLIAISSFAVLPGAAHISAQTSTGTPVATTTGPSNTVEAFVVLCQDVAVVNFSGTMLVGYDIFYQVFGGPNGTGTAFTGVRQVAAAGNFDVNERLAYNSGSTLATGATGSIRAFVARESNSSSIDFEFTVNDFQDGCTDANTTQPGTTTVSVDTTSGASAAPTTRRPGFTTSLFAPNGALLNPNLQPEADVVVGARPSANFRSQTPGLLFAECDEYPLALPGVIYDNDNVVIYWSWFTSTLEEMNEHLANANYSVTVNTARLNDVQRTEPVLRSGDYWIFYTYRAGNLRPGHYEVAYNLTWNQPVNDGYDDYGPGTANPREGGNCNFDVTRNPSNSSVAYTDMFFPTEYPVHNIFPND